MKIFKINNIFFVFAFWIGLYFPIYPICTDLYSSVQKVETKVTVYNNLFLTKSGLLPLPKNAIELNHKYSIQSDHFQFPRKMTSDIFGNIYISDKGKSSIYKFDKNGEFLQQIGKEGKKKGCFLFPLNILASDVLIVQDVKKKSLEYIDLEGKYIKSQKISGFIDISIDGNNRLYVAPDIQDEKSSLVKIYSSDGKMLDSFGQPLSFHHSMQILNKRTLALNSKGELYIAFTYFPIVRKYSSDGELLSEFRIENLITEVKDNFNLQRIGEGIANPLRRFGYIEVTIDIEIFKDEIYLLSDYPRLEILVMDETGDITSTYWKDNQEINKANDFLIHEIGNQFEFFVLHSFPSKIEINVFK